MAPVIVAVLALTLMVRVAPLRSNAFAKVRPAVALLSLSTSVPGLNVALPHVRVVPALPRLTFSAVLRAEKPDVPPVI